MTAKYLIGACECRAPAKVPITEAAKKYDLRESLLAKWVEYLARIEKQTGSRRPRTLRDAASGKLTGKELERSAWQLQEAITAIARQIDAEPQGKQATAQTIL